MPNCGAYPNTEECCDMCLDECESIVDQGCSEGIKYYCLYKTERPAMIASCVMFFINGLLGVAIVILLAKMPRDPCCYPNYAVQLVVQPANVQAEDSKGETTPTTL